MQTTIAGMDPPSAEEPPGFQSASINPGFMPLSSDAAVIGRQIFNMMEESDGADFGGAAAAAASVPNLPTTSATALG